MLILESETLGLFEAQTDEFVDIYPNPTKGIVNLRTDLEITNVVLFDCMGKLVTIDHNLNKQLDVSTLSKGIYFLKIYGGNKEIIKKIVIY